MSKGVNLGAFICIILGAFNGATVLIFKVVILCVIKVPLSVYLKVVFSVCLEVPLSVYLREQATLKFKSSQAPRLEIPNIEYMLFL